MTGRSVRRFVVLLVLAAAIAIAALALRGRQASQAAPRAAAAALAALELLPSDIAQARTATLRRTLPVTGPVSAVNQAVVKARVAGEVRDVLVREGEAVAAGQVVVRMDESEYRARLEQARGALAAARGQLDIAKTARENNRMLLDKGFISRNAFENSASQYAIAAANVDSANGALDVARKAVGDTVIRSPIAGLVSVRSVQPGEKVSPDNRLLEIVDLQRMEMEAAVPAADIGRVALGQEVDVRVEGLPDSLHGTVARINPATAAGSRSIPVYVQIDNPERLLRVGMFAEARLTLARKDDALVVPRTAVRNDGGGGAYVYAVENGRLARKTVATGMEGVADGEPAVEIRDGLAAGATIVRTNLGDLQAGAPVRVAARTASQ
ncbi:MAG: efflux RND transporter periplasmic adaptor subunit [Burkholderiaceae bacterium]